ncbi:hypothetical protein H0H81_009572, partial [Sphagnurus paluster]
KRTLEDDDADEDEEEPAGRPKPRRKRSKKSVPVVEDSDAAVEVPAPAAPREPKPRKPKAKGSRQERWAAMSSTDRADLAATVESHIAGEFNGASLDLAEVDDLGIPNLSRAALAHWNYAKSTIAPAPVRGPAFHLVLFTDLISLVRPVHKGGEAVFGAHRPRLLFPLPQVQGQMFAGPGEAEGEAEG